jgi:hypothetical protein
MRYTQIFVRSRVHKYILVNMFRFVILLIHQSLYEQNYIIDLLNVGVMIRLHLKFI